MIRHTLCICSFWYTYLLLTSIFCSSDLRMSEMFVLPNRLVRKKPLYNNVALAIIVETVQAGIDIWKTSLCWSLVDTRFNYCFIRFTRTPFYFQTRYTDNAYMIYSLYVTRFIFFNVFYVCINKYFR